MERLIVIFFIFSLIFLSNTALGSEVKIIKENEYTYYVVVTNVHDSGVGGFYLELSVSPNCKLSDVNVSSKDFLIAYNILNSSKLVIAGAQGKIPGPVGNVSIVKLKFNKKITNLTLLSISVSDVEGREILITEDSNERPNPMLSPTKEIKTPQSVVKTPLGVKITHTPKSSKSSENRVSEDVAAQSTPWTTATEPRSKKTHKTNVPSEKSTDVLKNSSITGKNIVQKDNKKLLPGFNLVFNVFILFCLSIFKKIRKK